jgi:hypothetical protein
MAIEPTGGPYINAALLCERAIQESDGVLTLVRVIDKLTASSLPGQEPSGFQPFQAALTLVVILRAGESSAATVRIVPREPDGHALQAHDTEVTFGGDDQARGRNLLVTMNLGVKYEGLYWFDVIVDGSQISRIPLRVEYVPAVDPGPQSQTEAETGE